MQSCVPAPCADCMIACYFLKQVRDGLRGSPLVRADFTATNDKFLREGICVIPIRLHIEFSKLRAGEGYRYTGCDPILEACC